MVQEFGGKLKNEQINAYVTEIGAKLAARRAPRATILRFRGNSPF